MRVSRGRANLRFQVTVDVPQLMQLVDSGEHFRHVEACMLFLEHSRVVQKCTEVSSGNVLHSEVYMLSILESVEKAHEPWGFGCCEDVPLNQHMSNLQVEGCQSTIGPIYQYR